MTLDSPNAFVQTPIPQDGYKVIMKRTTSQYSL